MQNLTDLIRIIPLSETLEPEDIFASAPGFLFTDDLKNQHGDPGDLIIYKSVVHGDIELRTADPNGEEERNLFSHYLWNAGVLMAERVSGLRLPEEEKEIWSVRGEKVLELGAGVGLSGIASTLSGADKVVISDYPAPVVLSNIRRNVKRNIPESLSGRVVVEGHEWGVLDDAFARENKHSFSRIVAADCYWMPHQHENLVQSMLHFLSLDHSARILAIAGFHTGRAKLAGFFDEAEAQGLAIEQIYEEDCDGVRREWQKEKDGGRENVTERKRWLVTAILRRAQSDKRRS